MLSSSGQRLLDPAALDTLIHELLPLASLYTPNLDEGACLLGTKPPLERREMLDMAKQLQTLGRCSVLLKGGHLPGDECPDLLIESVGNSQWFIGKRITTVNNHGTGCTLAAAIASNLASNGGQLNYAVEKSKNYLTETLASTSALSVGSGPGPLHHFVKLWH